MPAPKGAIGSTRSALEQSGAEMTEESFKRVGDYEILGVLGAGGMGKVYKVRNVISDRVEAMKILLPDLAGRRELADRFLREIKLLASLHHPNIAELRTALTWDNQLVMIMEYVEGVTLAARSKQGPISPEEAVDYTDQVLAALSYAHQLQIIHRDIKPSNMMLTPQGIVKLMDFGIARSKNDPILTASGSTLGSLHYMSPEQVKGESVDSRSDLYSVGVSLYEMATGRLPFEAENDFAIMAAHLQRSPEAPIKIRPDLPEALSDVILVAMAKDPAERFQSADAFRNALKSVQFSPPEPVHSPAMPLADASPEATIVAAAPSDAVISAVKSADGSSPSLVQASPEAQPLPAPSPAPVRPQASSPVAPQSSAAGSEFASSSQPQPVGQINPVAVSSQPPTATSHRGLYVSLGALIVLVVLVAAGLYVPRANRAHASHEVSAPPQPPVPSNPNVPPASSTPNPVTNASVPDTHVTAPAAAADTKQPTVNSTGALPSIKGSSTTAPGVAPPATTVSGEPKVAAAKSKGSESPRSASSARPKQEEHAALNIPAGNSPPPSVDAGQLQELEHEADLLVSRVDAVEASLNGMRQTQNAQGLGMRGDVLSSQQRMRTYMTKAEDALKNRDANGAKKYLGLAEPEVASLEKFLGR
jgi:serine/threonine protein kinase